MNRPISGIEAALRHLRITILLVMVAAVLSIAAPLTPVQAQDDRQKPETDLTGFDLAVSPPSGSVVCVGDSIPITVTVSASYTTRHIGGIDSNSTAHPPFINVQIDVTDASIGTIGTPKANASAGPTPQVLFTGKKSGTVVMKLKARVLNPKTNLVDTLNRPYAIEVKLCDYTLSGSVKFSAAKYAQIRHFTGNIYPIKLKSNADGSGFNGSGVLGWGEDISDSTCGSVSTNPLLLTTPVSITGKIEDRGIVLDLKFDPLQHSVCGTCHGASVCLPDEWKWEPVHVYFGDMDSLKSERKFSVKDVGPFTIILERSAAKLVPNGAQP